MATYDELRQLFSHGGLHNRVEVACIVAAEAIRGESDQIPNHANRLKWAQSAFNDPRSVSDKILMSVLAANKAVAVAAITGASDATLQSAVNTAVDLFADGS
jgi:hypothetical protein